MCVFVLVLGFLVAIFVLTPMKNIQSFERQEFWRFLYFCSQVQIHSNFIIVWDKVKLNFDNFGLSDVFLLFSFKLVI